MDNKIVVFFKPGCPYCKKAKGFLNSLNLPYKEISLNPSESNYEYKRDQLFNFYNHKSYPVIVINNQLVGGYSDLVYIYDTRKLHKLCSDIGLYLPINSS
jgi:alkyl hydroperoxide reductase subunit F